MKDGRVKNGEIFNTNSCGDLIVDNAVNYRCHDTENDYLERFHACRNSRLSWRKILSPYRQARQVRHGTKLVCDVGALAIGGFDRLRHT